MSNRKLLLPIIGIMLITLVLIGCGVSVPTQEPLTPTPIPPTATPKPSFFQPQPESTFTGSMKISKPGDDNTIKEGTLEFTISKDGTTITSVTVIIANTLIETKATFPITEGRIDINSSTLGTTVMKGQFSSATEAEGSIEIIEGNPFGESNDLGTWNWNAKAE